MSKWYGSFQNRMAERAKMPEPAVGMGATEMMYSDREPYEIIEIVDDRHIKVRQLGYKRIDKNGMSECQDYEYFTDMDGFVKTLFKTKEGFWREKIGRRLGSNFAIGYAERYYDFSF